MNDKRYFKLLLNCFLFINCGIFLNAAVVHEPKIQQWSEMLTIMLSHICSSNVHVVGLNNSRLGLSCEVQCVCCSSVVFDSTVTLKKSK